MPTDPHAQDPIEDVRLPLLIVDDNQELREQMSWALKRHYSIIEASDRSSAIQLLHHQKNVTLVTLDLGLPPDPEGVTEGFEALEQSLFT